MNIALEILNNENIPILIRVAVFHYLFVYIHPFYDGNGRTARFISSYYLAKKFHPIAALRLSYAIRKQQSEYYELIHDSELEINCGDLTPFIIGFASIFYKNIDEICCILSHKLMQINNYEKKIFELYSADEIKIKICLALLYGSCFLGEGVSMEELITYVKKSRNTIKNKLFSLPPDFVIVNKKDKKNFHKLNTLFFKKL